MQTQMDPNIDSIRISAYIRKLEIDNAELAAKVTKLQNDSIDLEKFYGTAISAEACARMHGVCVQTVRQYIHAGFIPRHPDSTDRKILIRTSDAITLDFRRFSRMVRAKNR